MLVLGVKQQLEGVHVGSIFRFVTIDLGMFRPELESGDDMTADIVSESDGFVGTIHLGYCCQLFTRTDIKELCLPHGAIVSRT